MVGEMAALVAKAAPALRAAAGSPEPARVEQLNPAPAPFLLAIGDDPDVGADAGVVEHLFRQGDDRFQPVVLDQPAADVAFAGAGAAGEQRRAAEDDGEPRAVPVLVRAHRLELGHHVLQKQ